MTAAPQRDWLAVARERVASGGSCALVTIVSARGSCPREAGACMLVTMDGIVGTIGGGQLEQHAVDLARARLTDRSPDLVQHTYSLGPDLGQCCGGSVDLAIEPLLRADPTVLARWAALRDAELPTDHLYLFGAGHVGAAVARIVATLPYRLHWLDSRDEAAATAQALGLPVVISRQPELEVASAAPDGFYLVMTHSHALDLDICARILKRGDFAFLGLIGSATKRARFARRLRAEGISEGMLARLVCPIGVPGIRNKLPAAIAVAAAAQLLTVSETRQRNQDAETARSRSA